ncbi:MAG TPA: hypothetical protein VFO93_09475 [Hymenobacter sp.]|uniref:hypothetical protein n=1 Tax=Hymenobacter sp. TaxID=1898978 RepID=UPI002D810FD2|nr:hypothetical protein [Hymenobacter sp.]HET9503761.1 hypothetical protein [Hymenobacter sp.]
MFDFRFHHLGGREYCRVAYDEPAHWLHLTWSGVATTPDSHHVATELLRYLPAGRVHYLLNDNSRVLGPWLDSVDWLQHIWVPQAGQLGLCYVAHVLQPHTEDDLGLLLEHNLFGDKFELQFFTSLEDAECWLRECQHAVPC